MIEITEKDLKWWIGHIENFPIEERTAFMRLAPDVCRMALQSLSTKQKGTKVYACPQCNTAMEIDPTAKPSTKQEWADISTAPRDGTRILLAGPDYPFVGVGYVEKLLSTDFIWERNEKLAFPTGWQPLPQPPAQEPKEPR